MVHAKAQTNSRSPGKRNLQILDFPPFEVRTTVEVGSALAAMFCNYCFGLVDGAQDAASGVDQGKTVSVLSGLALLVHSEAHYLWILAS